MFNKNLNFLILILGLAISLFSFYLVEMKKVLLTLGMVIMLWSLYRISSTITNSDNSKNSREDER